MWCSQLDKGNTVFLLLNHIMKERFLPAAVNMARKMGFPPRWSYLRAAANRISSLRRSIKDRKRQCLLRFLFFCYFRLIPSTSGSFGSLRLIQSTSGSFGYVLLFPSTSGPFGYFREFRLTLLSFS